MEIQKEYIYAAALGGALLTGCDTTPGRIPSATPIREGKPNAVQQVIEDKQRGNIYTCWRVEDGIVCNYYFKLAVSPERDNAVVISPVVDLNIPGTEAKRIGNFADDGVEFLREQGCEAEDSKNSLFPPTRTVTLGRTGAACIKRLFSFIPKVSARS